jgi:uncharacterized membrane protein
LLIAQAALFAIAVVPLARWAERVLGRRAAVVVTAGYGTSWGIAQAVGFDFHEACFAVPLLAFSLVALGEGRLGAAVAWALPLLLVKEDFGLTVAVIGGLVAWKGARRLGLVTAAAGLLGAVLELLVIIPAFSPAGSYAYWDRLPASDAGSGSELVHLLYRMTIGMVTPDIKAMTLLALLAPTAFLALRSPLLLVAVPTLAWRFFSESPPYWGTYFHYSAPLMPVVFAAFVDALTRWPAVAVRHALTVSGVITVLMFLQAPLHRLTQPTTWHPDLRVPTVHLILDKIPSGATAAASNHLAPQLTQRVTVSLFGLPGSRSDPEYVVADMKWLDWPFRTAAEELQQLDYVRSHGYRTIAEQDGIILLHRG